MICEKLHLYTKEKKSAVADRPATQYARKKQYQWLRTRKDLNIHRLILDEWLLYPLKEGEEGDVLELVEARAKTASTIFCSQFDVPGWHENLYDPTLADAICDRIVYDSYIIRVEGDSMRKRKGIMD